MLLIVPNKFKGDGNGNGSGHEGKFSSERVGSLTYIL